MVWDYDDEVAIKAARLQGKIQEAEWWAREFVKYACV